MGRKRKRSPAVNRSLSWTCPFFKWDGLQEISCEGGRIRLPDKKTALEYMHQHCAGDWHGCSVARAITDYYEGDNHGTEKNRPHKGPAESA